MREDCTVSSLYTVSLTQASSSIENDCISAPISEKISKTDFLFSLLFLCGLYTGIFFYFTDRLFIPFIICGLSAPYFLLKNFHSIRFSYLSPLIFLYVITGVGMVFAPEAFDQFSERFKGIIQLIYSSSVALLFFINMRKWDPKLVSKLFIGFALFILIGATLEVYTPFKYLSDDFRHWIFRRGVYEADWRDLYIYGQIRPKLFTSEPSHVAKFYILSLFVWFALSKNAWRYMAYIFLAVVGLIVIRSPIIILSIPLALAVEIFLRKSINLGSIVTKEKPVIQGTLFALIIISLLFLAAALSTILAQRTRIVIAGTDGSFAGRITGPALITLNTVKEYPIWGAGITGKEAISDVIFDSYWAVGVRRNDVYAAGCNFLALFISYYGVLGGVLFVVGFMALLRRLEIKNGMFVTLSILIFSQTMGGFVGLRTWGYVFIVALVASYSRYSMGSEKEKTIYAEPVPSISEAHVKSLSRR